MAKTRGFQVLTLTVLLFCYTTAEFSTEREEKEGGFKEVSLNQAELNSSSCEHPFFRVGDRCYYLSRTKANYFQAAEFCRHHQSQLVSIETAEENKFIKSLLNKTLDGYMDFAWTSGEDMGKEGSWMWMGTGEKINYTDWSYSNPDNYMEIENCLNMPWQHGFEWNDADCKMEGNFICEVSLGHSIRSPLSCTKIAFKLMDMVKATMIKYIDKVAEKAYY